MAEITVTIPDELERKLKDVSLDVSGVVSLSLQEELSKLLALRMLAGKSKLTEQDALELGRKVKKGRAIELKKEGLL
tara:strand:- start:191 stop:421 length:231 start_codon:yes stop_codon:yes gene_type:complete